MRNILILMTALLMSIVTVSFDIQTDTVPDPPSENQIQVDFAIQDLQSMEAQEFTFLSIPDEGHRISKSDVLTVQMGFAPLIKESRPLPITYLDKHYDPGSSRSYTFFL